MVDGEIDKMMDMNVIKKDGFEVMVLMVEEVIKDG